MSDYLGARGEAIARLRLTDAHENSPLFRPHFLGDKWPGIDLYSELVGIAGKTPFFLAQVKATARVISMNRLPIAVSREEVARLHSYGAPTYIIGIEAKNEKAFIAWLGSRKAGFSSMTAAHPLNAANRRILWQEVKDFWARYDGLEASSFTDPAWR